MAASTVYTPEDAAYWYVPLMRAIVAAALACVVTFSAGNYTPAFGLFTFGGFAVVAGVLGVILSFRGSRTGIEHTVFLVQAIVSILAGAGAIVGWRTGLPLFIVLVSSWAVIAGALELYLGLRSRGRRAVSRDWTFVGGLTVLVAIVVLVVPPGYSQKYVSQTGEPRVLNASVTDVGALGVYGAIVAVYLVIAALSLKWGSASVARPESTDAEATK
jgi:hypothetical protein